MAKKSPARKKNATVINPAQWATAAKRFGGKLSRSARAAISKQFKSKRNPHAGWFDECVAAVRAHGGADDPRAVCGAMEKKLNPVHRNRGPHSRKAKHNPGSRKSKVRVIRHKVHKGAKYPNPVDAAYKRFEFTHGRPPEEIIEIVEGEHIHTVLPAYGRLESLSILCLDGRTQVTLTDFKGAMLCENEQADKHPQLFIEGGDQAVSLREFSITGHEHEAEVLGAALEIAYKTRKDHLGKSGGAGERVTHVHPFTSKRGMDSDDPRRHNSRPPLIIYDIRNAKLRFAGGTYDLPEVGIRG